jgi:hypothetical protein
MVRKRRAWRLPAIESKSRKATRLGVSVKTVDRMVARGELAAPVRIHGCDYFSVDAEPVRVVDIRRDDQIQEWLTVDFRGRIEHHIDRGAGTRSQWTNIDHVKAYWPHLAAEIENALAELP